MNSRRKLCIALFNNRFPGTSFGRCLFFFACEILAARAWLHPEKAKQRMPCSA